MTDLVTRIAEQVRYQYMPAETRAVLDEAASLLRSQAEENARLREAVASADFWLTQWAVHVGSCAGGDRCTCGLTAISAEATAALNRSGEP